VTGEQIRAARALLKWSARELAEASGIGWATIQRIESKDGPVAGYGRTHDAIRRALETHGVQFLDGGQVSVGPGVALKKNEGQ